MIFLQAAISKNPRKEDDRREILLAGIFAGVVEGAFRLSHNKNILGGYEL